MGGGTLGADNEVRGAPIVCKQWRAPPTVLSISSFRRPGPKTKSVTIIINLVTILTILTILTSIHFKSSYISNFIIIISRIIFALSHSFYLSSLCKIEMQIWSDKILFFWLTLQLFITRHAHLQFPWHHLAKVWTRHYATTSKDTRRPQS